MDLNNTPNLPGTDKPPVNYLPFTSVADLSLKIEKLQFLKSLNSALLEGILDRYKIPFSKLPDGAVVMDAGVIPEPCLQEVTECLQQMGKNLRECYEALGIVTANKQEGNDPSALYEGLIQLLTNRKN